ncbi:efflux RND transporter periplasmic adaptor subunit [Paenibacillus sp. sptzw28]|uniref:efflux RND transporter periplasmic adaptor subunit n=1 Tax=Paenibacillus sp. sptzw28 TaxID=715179 RepID=UPI001C6F4F27|nr:efflux RND transporter periplasmic adaptor subunit [Paenibacillus sp. sptzw28]QYR20373.1 efflux RND transporter periplasmic adaptor subunit [Paenibacillus sp. sptzw28]
MGRNRKRRRLLFKQSSVILLASALLSGCSLLPQDQKELQPPLVKPAQEKFDSVEAKKGRIERFFSGTAIVASSRNIPLFYSDNGRLKDIYVKQDDTVREGQLLAELDMGDLDLRIKLQKLSLERANLEYMRVKQSGTDKDEIRLREIDAQRERILLDALEKQMESARLTAPIDGIVSFKDTIQPGDGITGYKPIVSVSDPKQIYLVYEAEDPKTISAIQLHMDVEITVDNQKLKGRVLQAPSSAPFTDNKELAERNAKLLYVGLSTPNDKLALGQSADIRIMLEEKDNVIVLPRSGLRTYLGRTYVQVLEGDRRKEVDVEPGLMTSTEVEIVKGLEPGQQVILNN